MSRMLSALVVVGTVASCESADRGPDQPAYETLHDDDFSTFPYLWEFSGAGVLENDPSFGFPAPSGFLQGSIDAAVPLLFTYQDQLLDVRVTSFLQETQTFGVQSAVLRVRHDYTSTPRAEIAYAAYDLINNRDVDYPVPGYPAGVSTKVRCAFEGGPPTHFPVPYNDGTVAYDLFVTIDDDGMHCGFDDTVVSSTTTTSVTGTVRVALGATMSTNAWFDSLVVRRAN